MLSEARFRAPAVRYVRAHRVPGAAWPRTGTDSAGGNGYADRPLRHLDANLPLQDDRRKATFLSVVVYTFGMSDPITFRPTPEDAKNLAILTADGTSPTHALRHALEFAAHEKHQADLRADAARLVANPDYQAEVRAVREELDELRAW